MRFYTAVTSLSALLEMTKSMKPNINLGKVLSLSAMVTVMKLMLITGPLKLTMELVLEMKVSLIFSD